MVNAIFLRTTAALAGAVLLASPAATQMQTVDPSSAQVEASRSSNDIGTPVPVDETSSESWSDANAPAAAPGGAAPAGSGSAAQSASMQSATYREEEVLGKAEEVFGKGAEGLAKIVQDILKNQGEPNGYIAGREGGAAFIAGLRYGQGTLFHKVEGQRDVFWSGPSIGFDAGGNGSKTFVLVYNLYDGEDIFRRYPAAEGNLYAVGGFTASYLRRNDVVLIPIRLGVGWRFGANVGYMKFTKKGTVIPF